jgi:hypothetical protein
MVTSERSKTALPPGLCHHEEGGDTADEATEEEPGARGSDTGAMRGFGDDERQVQHRSVVLGAIGTAKRVARGGGFGHWKGGARRRKRAAAADALTLGSQSV